jgi:predicted permease
MTGGLKSVPRIAERILRASAPAGDADQIAADLEEALAKRTATLGVARARWWYRWQVARSVGPLVRLRVAGALAQLGGPAPILSDFRFSLRQIGRAPLFYSVLIAVIGLGIGINAGLFTVANVYVGRPAPGIESDSRLVRLAATRASRSTMKDVDTPLSYRDIVDLRELRAVFGDVAGWQSHGMVVDLGGGAQSATGTYVTDNYFLVLGVHMAAGTGFPESGERAAVPLVVIGHMLWVNHFASSPTAIGKSVRIGNQRFTIVGVAPPEFVGVNNTNLGRDAVWVPLAARPMLEPDAADALTRRDRMELNGFARLAGVKAGEVAHATRALATRFAVEDPVGHARFSISAARMTGIDSRESNDFQEIMFAFTLIGGLVVAITCTNVSALLLGRAVSRRREIGIRLSLGASRARIIRQLLTECLVVSFAGAAFGLTLYVVGVKVAYAVIPELIYGLRPERDTFAFAAVFAVLVTVVFGLVPALHASREGIATVVKDGGSRGMRRSRLQAAFVVAQLACSQPVLVVTALLLADLRHDSYGNADKAPPNVATMSLELFTTRRSFTPAANDSAIRNMRAVLAATRAQVAAIPGVSSAGVGVSGWAGDSRFETAEGGALPPVISQTFVSADYFTTTGIPLRRGRAIGVSEDRQESAVVVVSEAAAKLLWPNEDPLGKRLVRVNRGGSEERTTLEVIGVVGVAEYDEGRERPVVFVPLTTIDFVPYAPGLAVRTAGDAQAYMPAIRRAIREIDPLLPVTRSMTMAERYARRRAEAMQVSLGLFTVGGLALALASLGLYAIIAFAVAQRTKEIGIRLAVGATTREVVHHFFRGGMLVTAIGLAIGLPVTVIGIKLIAANMLGFTVQNLATVGLILIAIAGIASWLPARRAATVDPLIALRSE